jgi:hypothetical protein
MGMVYPFLLCALCGQRTSWRLGCKAHEVEDHIPGHIAGFSGSPSIVGLKFSSLHFIHDLTPRVMTTPSHYAAARFWHRQFR